MTKLLHRELTGRILRTYFDVYNGLAHTYPEYIFENAMMGDLQQNGIACLQQPDYPIPYKDVIVGLQRLDLFVADEVVVELKVVPELTKLHKAQGISYIKVVGKQIALLLNFGSAQPQFERLYYHERTRKTYTPNAIATMPDGILTPELTHKVIGGLYEVHNILGPGFIHRIYANAVHHEMKLRGLDVTPRKAFDVFFGERSVGKIKFNHIQIDNRLLIFSVTIQNMTDVGLFTNIKTWLQKQKIPLCIIANFHPASLEFTFIRA